MRILVLDDYRPHGETLVDLIQTQGHEAIYAESYADAKWLVDLLRFDLAFLDFDMPDLSGPAVAARLARRFPSLRSVIISAHPPSGSRREELGDLAFLQKPVATEALLGIIHEVEQALRGLSIVLRSRYSLKKYR